jgi:hypothetical protein
MALLEGLNPVVTHLLDSQSFFFLILVAVLGFELRTLPLEPHPSPIVVLLLLLRIFAYTIYVCTSAGLLDCCPSEAFLTC